MRSDPLSVTSSRTASGVPYQSTPRSTIDCASARKCSATQRSRTASGWSGKHSSRFLRTMRTRDFASFRASQPSAAPTRSRVDGRIRPNHFIRVTSVRVFLGLLMA